MTHEKLNVIKPIVVNRFSFVRDLKIFVLGALTVVVIYGINWSIHYFPAIKTTIMNPEAVMQIRVETKYEVKK